MKKSVTITLIFITAILSLFPVSLSAGSAGTAVVTLQKHPKQPKDTNRNPDRDGQRTPSSPVTVYFSKSEGIYSPYFDIEDVISFAVLDDTGQSVFTTDDIAEFLDYLVSCQDMVWVQFEFDEYYIDGWLQIRD